MCATILYHNKLQQMCLMKGFSMTELQELRRYRRDLHRIPELDFDLPQTIAYIEVGSLSALGYGPLARFTVFGMQFLDFFDFLTNSVMMPIAAITTCLLVSRVIGVEKIEEEVTLCGKPFRRKRIFNFMIKYLCPIFAAVILISSVANALGVISM